MKLTLEKSLSSLLLLMTTSAEAAVVTKTNVVYVTVGAQNQAAVPAKATTLATVVHQNNQKNGQWLSPPSSSSSYLSSLNDFQKTILDDHNSDRSKDDASALSWDFSKLQYHAESYAQKLCSIGSLVHSGTKGMGENLYWVGTTDSTGHKLASNSVKAWYDEKLQYHDGLYSHYSQLVWKSTKKLGCGYSKCSNGKGTYVVCNYDPQGNIIGQSKVNVA